MRSNRGSRRQFQWVRVQGNTGNFIPNSAGNAGFAAVDLLGPARTLYGQLLDAGATVMSIKGYAKPNVFPGSGAFVYSGAVGIRRCSRTDVEEPREQDAPTVAVSEDEPFMYYNPWIVTASGEDTIQDLYTADSSVGTRWALNVRSHRKLPQLSQTLGLFAGIYQDPGTFDYSTVDYHLSLGMKLP